MLLLVVFLLLCITYIGLSLVWIADRLIDNIESGKQESLVHTLMAGIPVSVRKLLFRADWTQLNFAENTNIHLYAAAVSIFAVYVEGIEKMGLPIVSILLLVFGTSKFYYNILD